ncbi:LacI family DNA-binding transcriptional regulator [Pseudolysinimonas sp.]|jgi:LacI family transcriptional regulator|uniref:LacI family DNA-binding transcriptional regulator n=1 Tax=Pseudolysinimonas sp. TaxID=2680009 RepID=UPI003784D98F
MATIKDVARLAQVSAGTVSNVLNRPSYVNVATRERVLAAIRELDFVPHQGSRQFRPGRVRTLGLAVANLDNPFFVDVALGAEERCAELGVGVVITNSGYDPVRETHNLDLLVQSRVQGIIIAPVDENSSRLEMLKDRGVPMVFVDRVGDDRDCWSVVVDDFRGGQIGMRHLIGTGHRRIAFLGHPETSPKVRTRLAGARSVVAEHPEVTLELIDADSWSIEAGRSAGTRLVDRAADRRPTAVFCANDMLALGLAQQLLRDGIRIPEEVAIVGYDDLEWASVSSVPLTTVRQPRQGLGRTAVDMILELLGRPSARIPRSNHVVLQPELVVRDSA